jgi:hypothetical protein
MHGRAVLLLLLLLQGLADTAWGQAKPGLVELTADDFVATFKALPEDRWVLAEFYAHW